MWERVINYFQTLDEHPAQRMAFLVAGLLFFWIVEGSIPLLTMKYKRGKLRHAAVNLGFTTLHLIIHTFLAIIIIKLSDWCKVEQFGLVYWLGTGITGTIMSLSWYLTSLAAGWFISPNIRSRYYGDFMLYTTPTIMWTSRQVSGITPLRAFCAGCSFL